MPANKHLLSDKSQILKKKLDLLSSKLQGSLRSDELVTREQYLFESIKVLQEFYKTLNSPQTEVPSPRADDWPDFENYDKLWNQIIDDLVVIFTELENIETLSLANFNFIVTEANRLTTRVKSISSKLGDYILYSLNANKDSLFFKDSFNDLSKVDIGISLLNSDECEVNQDEGIVTLPVNRDIDSSILITAAPIINPNSNGVIGNNQQVGYAYNGDLSVVLDNNPDTWFEYERITTGISDTKEPLTLDMTINLGDPKVINQIRINPNNFGTKTIILIDGIDTSYDGQVYTSIKDDIPIAGFTTEDEENVFILAPSTSKYAGQGIYSFTPRMAKYVHFTLRQTEPYNIETLSGTRLRYAIGIRDIEILGINYKNKGELVSIPFETTEEIRKVLLQANQNPSKLSELVTVDYSLSPDDGQSWHPISPKEFSGLGGSIGTPEILEFNGSSENTIDTSVPAKSLRLKIAMSRNDTAFKEGSSSVKKEVAIRSEVHDIPSNSPYKLVLERPPVDGSVVVIDPLFGSRGLPGFPYIIGHASDRMDMQTYRLPLKLLPRPVEKAWDGSKYFLRSVPVERWMHLEVGGEEWTHATKPISDYTSTDKVYTFNPNDGVLRVGNGTHGKLPAENAPLAVWFDEEDLFPSIVDNNHLAKIEFPTASNKRDFVIKRYERETETVEIVSRKATVIHLEFTDITDYSAIYNISEFSQSNEKTFLNGAEELSGTGEWSIDTIRGIIYLYDPTPANRDITISYKYLPSYTLSLDDWDWGKTDFIRDSISIKESAWRTISIENEEIIVASGVKVLDVSQLYLVKGTVSFELTESGIPVDSTLNPFLKEAKYIDGSTELGSEVINTVENLSSHDGTGAKVYTLSEAISLSTEYTIVFSNTELFVADVSPSLPTSNGQYKIDRTTKEITVFSNIARPAGNITYFYTNPNFSNNGLYSVDYKNGRIYMQRPMQGSIWEFSVSYEYTNFKAQYKIARMLNPNDYEVDITNGTIFITDREFINQIMIPKSGLYGKNSFYLVNYEYVKETREDIESLKNFFTPVIKDYMLKILTKDRLL